MREFERIWQNIDKYQSQYKVFQQIVADSARVEDQNIHYQYAIDFHQIHDYAFPSFQTFSREQGERRPSREQVILRYIFSGDFKTKMVLMAPHFEEMLSDLRYRSLDAERLLKRLQNQISDNKLPDLDDNLQKIVSKQASDLSLDEENNLIRKVGGNLVIAAVNYLATKSFGFKAIRHILDQDKLISEYDLPDITQDDFEIFYLSQGDRREIFDELYRKLKKRRRAKDRELANIRDTEACTKIYYINRYIREKLDQPWQLQLITGTNAVVDAHEAFIKNHKEDTPFVRSVDYLFFHHVIEEIKWNADTMEDQLFLVRDFLEVFDKYNKYRETVGYDQEDHDRIAEDVIKIDRCDKCISRMLDIGILSEETNLGTVIEEMKIDDKNWEAVIDLLLKVLRGEDGDAKLIDEISLRIGDSLQVYDSIRRKFYSSVAINILNLDDPAALNRMHLQGNPVYIDYDIQLLGQNIRETVKTLFKNLPKAEEDFREYINAFGEELGRDDPKLEKKLEMALIAAGDPSTNLSVNLLEQIYTKINSSDRPNKAAELSELCLLQAVILRLRGPSELARAYRKCLWAFEHRKYEIGKPNSDWRFHKELGVVILTVLEHKYLERMKGGEEVDYLKFVKETKFMARGFDDAVKFHKLAHQHIREHISNKKEDLASIRGYMALINNLLYLKLVQGQLDDEVEEFVSELLSYEKHWRSGAVCDTLGLYHILMAESNLSDNSEKAWSHLKDATNYVDRALKLDEKCYHHYGMLEYRVERVERLRKRLKVESLGDRLTDGG